jgi:hypothetical protein
MARSRPSAAAAASPLAARDARDRDRARRRLLDLVAELAPDVLRDLAERATGLGELATLADLAGLRELHRLDCGGSTWRGSFGEVELAALDALDAAPGTLAPLEEALAEWASRWRLEATWVRRVAVSTLAAWARDPDTPHTEWSHGLLALGAEDWSAAPAGPVRCRETTASGAIEWEAPGKHLALEPWNPGRETRGQARARLLAAVDAHLDAAARATSEHPGGRGPRALEADAAALVRWRVLGERVGETTARRLRELARWLGLPVAPGRPRKRP